MADPNIFDTLGGGTAVAEPPQSGNVFDNLPAKSDNVFDNLPKPQSAAEALKAPVSSFATEIGSGDPRRVMNAQAALLGKTQAMTNIGLQSANIPAGEALQAPADEPGLNAMTGPRFHDPNPTPIKLEATPGMMTRLGIGPEDIQQALTKDRYLKPGVRTSDVGYAPSDYQPEGYTPPKPGFSPVMPAISAAKTVSGIADWMTSPSGSMQLAAAGVPVLNVVMAGKFAKDMVEGGYMSAKEVGEAAAAGDWQRVSDGIINYAANVYGAKKVGEHGIQTAKGYVDNFRGRGRATEPTEQAGVAPSETQLDYGVGGEMPRTGAVGFEPGDIKAEAASRNLEGIDLLRKQEAGTLSADELAKKEQFDKDNQAKQDAAKKKMMADPAMQAMLEASRAKKAAKAAEEAAKLKPSEKAESISNPELQKLAEMSNDEFVKATDPKTTGTGRTNLSYDYADKITTADIPWLEKKEQSLIEQLDKLKSDETLPGVVKRNKLGSQKQFINEVIRQRRAQDLVNERGVTDPAELEKIQKDAGGGPLKPAEKQPAPAAETPATPSKQFENKDAQLSAEIDKRGGVDKVSKSNNPSDVKLMEDFQKNQSDWEKSVSAEKAKFVSSMSDEEVLKQARQSLLSPVPELKAESDAHLSEISKRGLTEKLKNSFEPGIYDKLRQQYESPKAETAQTAEPISVGPGASSAGADLPPEPPVSQTPEQQRPNGVITPTSPILHSIGQALLNLPTAVGDLGHNVSMAIKGIAGKTLPRLTKAMRSVGELGARYGSSRIAARPLAKTFSTTALEGTGLDPAKFGAALTEDNLRSVREGYRGRATQLLADGDAEGAAKATAAADKVASIIGGKNSPFKTEDDYQAFLNDPKTKQAVAQHIQQWQETVEPQYKAARDLDPDLELPTRGQQTGARVNLKALTEDDTPSKAVEIMAAAPRLTGTFKRQTPFAIKAKGTGLKYETDYHEIIANTFEKQLEIANKNAFDNGLVEHGLAEIHRPGWNGTIDGKRAVPFPLKRGARAITTADGEKLTANQAANIYVRADLAGEYRTVSNVDPRLKIPFATGLMNIINRVQLAGLTDFTVHSSNLMTALFNNPTTGKLLGDSLLSATGRADVPVTLVKVVLKAFQDNTKQISQLAEIGALRSATPHGNWSGRILQSIDKTTRLVLDDTYKKLVDSGIVKDNETNRREFVNQVGQYNRRLQPRLMGFLRESGVSPFVTAGRTFTAMGIRQVTLKPTAEATNLMAATGLRLNMLSKWVGAATLIGTLNYLLTKDKKGGVLGRPGNPLGRVDFGIEDKTGRPLGLPLLDLLGLGRGLRVSGIKGFSDSLRYGLPLQTALDAAGRDIINSQISPLAGPAVRTGLTAAVGQAPGIGLPRTAPVAPPTKNQLAVNATAALRDANPIISSVMDKIEGKTTAEAMQRQLPRFTLQPGKPPEMMDKYPRIVEMAQGKAYVDDVIHRARAMPLERRRKFVEESISKMPPEDQDHARKEMVRRRVFR